LHKGARNGIKVTVLPENATNKAVSITSNQPDVVSVTDEGLLTSVSLGDAKITVTAADGKKWSFTVTVGPASFSVKQKLKKERRLHE